jgi:fluoride exporter
MQRKQRHTKHLGDGSFGRFAKLSPKRCICYLSRSAPRGMAAFLLPTPLMRPTLAAMDYLLVGLGGFLGANARYVLSTWIVARAGTLFPLHTLLINVSGSLAIGVILVLLTERLSLDPAWRLLLVVGFLGGYTTFSSYTIEALGLIEAGEWLLATWYVLGSNGLGLAATLLGMSLARNLGR